MLTPKEISSLFEVQINTLYNWRKTKPKLYAYLQNADDNAKFNTELNTLFDSYSKTLQKEFSIKEIRFLIDNKVTIDTIDQIANYHKVFIKTNHQRLLDDEHFILALYDKLKALNIIEKYILYKKIEDSNETTQLKTFFKPFIQQGEE